MLGTESITKAIKTLFTEGLRTPAKVIPGIIMICSLAQRPGLSCLLSFGRIIQELEKEGIPTGPLPDGQKNMLNIVVKNIVCEVYRSLKEDSNIQIAFPPGAMNITATGGNAGGPFVAKGFNTNIGTANGLIS